MVGEASRGLNAPTHRLAELLFDAACGRFPPADAEIEVVGQPPGPCDAVVAFTAHHIVASAAGRDEVLAQLPPDDLGAPMGARFLAWLGDRLRSEPGMLDLVLVADSGESAASASSDLARRADLADHPRVARAARYRRSLATYGDPAGDAVLVLGRGLADRLEVSVEVEPRARGRGLGRALAATARALVPADEPLFAQVSPGNAASVRAFLAAGYRPIAAEVLFVRSE